MRGDKRERILRVLLNEKQELSKYRLAQKAQCARPWAIEFLRKLEKMKLTKGAAILDRRKLLRYWFSIHKKSQKYKTYLVQEPLKLLRETDLEYALTTTHAENIVHHYLFPTRVDIYIKEEDKEKWHILLSKRGLVGGGNMRVIVVDPHVMYAKQKINKLWIVSTPQLIIDLFSEGGPCTEAAEMMIEHV